MTTALPLQQTAALVRVAREARGLTQGEVAQRAGISQSALSKIEACVRSADDEVLEKLAAALALPPEFFRRNTRLLSEPPFHRARAYARKRAVERLHGQMRIRWMHIYDLLKSVDVEQDGLVPQLEPSEDQGPEEIAMAVRALWSVPPGPIPNLMALLERYGCIVVMFDFGTVGVEGITYPSVDGAPNIIFANSASSPDRLRFTLAHELGHLVMHATRPLDPKQMESEADAFASAFLMPATDIERQLLTPLNEVRLAQLKLHWRVSMAALVMRAFQLECISDRQRRTLFMKLAPYRKKEPVDIDREHPTALRDIIEAHRTGLNYSIPELCTLLTLLESDISEWLPAPVSAQPKLRLVRGAR